MSSRGLGRGIDSILPSDININRLVPGISVQEIDVSELKPNPKQPRRTISDIELSELAQSIREHGVLQPLLISKIADDYEIIAGERRFRAAKKAGLKTVPCIVKNYSELQTLEVALIENMQREDLGPLEQAASIKRLHDDFEQTYEQIAKRLGRAYASVANNVRLLNLPTNIQDALTAGKISEGHARSLLSLQDTNKQEVLFKQIVSQGWSVRRAEQFVKEVKASGELNKKSVQRNSKYVENNNTKALSKKLNTTVVINPMAKGGFIKIEYKNDTDLEAIFEKIN